MTERIARAKSKATADPYGMTARTATAKTTATAKRIQGSLHCAR
jgi:hypothetical protein